MGEVSEKFGLRRSALFCGCQISPDDTRSFMFVDPAVVRSPIYGLAHGKLLARAVRPKWNGGCRPLTVKLLWANELHLHSTRIVSDVKEPALLLREDTTVEGLVRV